MTGCVTIEWLIGLVRLHSQPATFGEYAPFENGFAVVQVEPGIFEAKIGNGTVLSQDQHRDLRQKMEAMGAQAVFYWRYKVGRPPYKVWIAKRTQPGEEECQLSE